ncbi:telomere-associated protein RIF1-like [Uloborus diversus]|uniref:telomere-associated protein RIF1-like n=1 Tax=Uloborus diversus TaxID=327109 RepID=UPI00240A0768|nr:telomere-associated protein RIF1-like [Uloborus diversus]
MHHDQNKDGFSKDIQSKSLKETQSACELQLEHESIIDLNHIENENILVPDQSSEVHTSEKGSKKRKAKPPVRSPFNFRHRSKTDAVQNKPSKFFQPVAKDVLFEILKKSSMFQSEIEKNMDDHLPSEKTLSASSADEPPNILDIDNVNVINESLDCEEVMIDYAQPTKMEINNDELTNLHTRLNANTAPHTRRSQIIAASHMVSNSVGKQIPKPVEENGIKLPTSSILKKENSVSSRLSSKNRVTFADPLVHEKLIEEGSDWNAIEITVVSDKPLCDSKKRKRIISGRKNKAVETKEILASAIESDEIPSSSEHQDSDTLTNYSDIPVSPSLINCQDSISCILQDLTSPTWIRGLESLLISKNMKTVGDICRLNIHELKALPFKSPKVQTLHKALLSHLDNIQKATLEKLNNIDDGCSIIKDNNSAPSEVDEILTDQAEKMEESVEDLQLQSQEKILEEFLNQNNFSNIPNILLTRTIEKCANVLSQRLGSC